MVFVWFVLDAFELLNDLLRLLLAYWVVMWFSIGPFVCESTRCSVESKRWIVNNFNIMSITIFREKFKSCGLRRFYHLCCLVIWFRVDWKRYLIFPQRVDFHRPGVLVFIDLMLIVVMVDLFQDKVSSWLAYIVERLVDFD